MIFTFSVFMSVFYTLIFTISFFKKSSLSNFPTWLVYTSSYILPKTNLALKKYHHQKITWKNQSFCGKCFKRNDHYPQWCYNPPEGKKDRCIKKREKISLKSNVCVALILDFYSVVSLVFPSFHKYYSVYLFLFLQIIFWDIDM